LNIDTGKASETIDGTSSIKSGWRTTKILEESNLPVLVNYTVALKHDTTLEFAIRVACREF
jgi:hypothetical protein